MTKKPSGTAVSRSPQAPPGVSQEELYVKAIVTADEAELKKIDIPRATGNKFQDAIEHACREEYEGVVLHLVKHLDLLDTMGRAIIKYGNHVMINAFAMRLSINHPEYFSSLFFGIGKRPAALLQLVCNDIKTWDLEIITSFLKSVASFSNVATMEIAIGKNTTVNETILFTSACDAGNLQVAKYLLERERGSVNPAGIFSSLNYVTKELRTSLMQDLNFFKKLVEDVRVIDLANAFRTTLKSENVIALNWLLENAKARESIPDNLILMAVRSRSLRCLHFLLTQKDFDPSGDHNAALINCIGDYASGGKSLNMIKALLLDARVNPSDQQNKAILIACGKVTRGISEVVRLLLQDPRVDPTVNNNAALGHAVRLGQKETVWELLQHPKVKVRVKMVHDTLDKIRTMKLKNPEPFINSSMMLIPRLQPMPKFAEDPKMKVLLPRLAESRLRILYVLQLCERGGYSSNVPCGNNVVGLPNELFGLIINFMGEPYQGHSLETLRLFLLKVLERHRQKIKKSALLLDSSEQEDLELSDFMQDIYP